jgi:hypothetical protein
MNKSAEDLIQELKEGKLSSFWISRNDDVPWVDKITIVTKNQQSEIIDLFLDILKTKKIIKVPKNRNIKGFCKKGDSDLSISIYDELEQKDKDSDFLVYAEDGEYSGMSILTTIARRNSRWDIYVNLLCSIKKGTGTKIINLIKDAIKTNKRNGAIELHPLQSALEFYKKMGFQTSHMIWYHFNKPNIKQDVQIEDTKVGSGGYRKNGIKTLKIMNSKNAKTTSRNFTEKSRKLI